MKKLYLWGTGKNCIKVLESVSIEKVSAFIETVPKNEIFMGKPVIAPTDLKLNEEDVLMITVRKPTSIIESIKNDLNIRMESVVCFDFSGFDDVIFWAARQTILEDYLTESEYLKLIRGNSIDSLLYNSVFVQNMCMMEGMSFPREADRGGYMIPYMMEGLDESRLGRLLKLCNFK